jgi:hypothetical protein
VATLVTAAGLARAAEKLVSAWADTPLAIDGANDEWQNRATYLKDEGLSVGVMNDTDFLYVVVAASEPQRRMQLARAGLIIWLDSTGRKAQTFGISVPGALTAGARGTRPGAASGGRMVPDISTVEEAFSRPLEHIELLGPGKDDRRRLDPRSDAGIEVAHGSFEGTLVLEVKVPLVRTDDLPVAVNAHAGQPVGLGLETPQISEPLGDRPSGIGGRAGGPTGGVGGPRGGTMGGRSGGGMGQRGAVRGNWQPATPLDFWATVQLSGEGA